MIKVNQQIVKISDLNNSSLTKEKADILKQMDAYRKCMSMLHLTSLILMYLLNYKLLNRLCCCAKAALGLLHSPVLGATKSIGNEPITEGFSYCLPFLLIRPLMIFSTTDTNMHLNARRLLSSSLQSCIK